MPTRSARKPAHTVTPSPMQILREGGREVVRVETPSGAVGFIATEIPREALKGPAVVLKANLKWQLNALAKLAAQEVKSLG